MPSFTELDNDSLGADKIARTATAVALYDNPKAIAERGTSAPIVQVPIREYKTSGTGATWTIPAGVTAFNVYVGGGCGGSGGTPTASTVVYNGVTYTGGAGGNGAFPGTGSGGAGGAGGTASGGNRNITGQGGTPGGTQGVSGVPIGGTGGQRPLIGGNGAKGDDGVLNYGGQGGGGAGGVCVARILVVSGQTTATYTIGAGGTGADGGLVIFEY